MLVIIQGFVITLPYCFLNSEVRGVVRTRWDRWQLIRSVGADTNGSNRTSGDDTVKTVRDSHSWLQQNVR